MRAMPAASRPSRRAGSCAGRPPPSNRCHHHHSPGGRRGHSGCQHQTGEHLADQLDRGTKRVQVITTPSPEQARCRQDAARTVESADTATPRESGRHGDAPDTGTASARHLGRWRPSSMATAGRERPAASPNAAVPSETSNGIIPGRREPGDGGGMTATLTGGLGRPPPLNTMAGAATLRHKPGDSNVGADRRDVARWPPRSRCPRRRRGAPWFRDQQLFPQAATWRSRSLPRARQWPFRRMRRRTADCPGPRSALATVRLGRPRRGYPNRRPTCSSARRPSAGDERNRQQPEILATTIGALNS
jgi:hypothetical protein